MIAATLLLATASISVRAQAPGQPTPPAAMPMTNCGGNSGGAMAEGQKTGCPCAPETPRRKTMKSVLKNFRLVATALAAAVILVGASPNFAAFPLTTSAPAA